MMDSTLCTVLLVGADTITYFSIRDLLWSVIWLERRGKYNKLNKFRKSIPFMDRVSMKTLVQYVDNNRQPYEFWIRIKSVFLIIQAILLGIYLITFCFHAALFGFIRIAITVQALIWFLVIRIQFDSSWNTKYDLKRRGLKKKG